MKFGSLIRDKASGLMKTSLKSEVNIDRIDRSRKAKVDNTHEHKIKEVNVNVVTDFPPSPERNSPSSSKCTLNNCLCLLR